MYFLLSIIGFVISYMVVKKFINYFNIQENRKTYKRSQIFIIQAIVTTIIAFIFTYSNNAIGIGYGIVTGSILSLISSFFKIK